MKPHNKHPYKGHHYNRHTLRVFALCIIVGVLFAVASFFVN
jgi:hypothetical protein